MRLAPVSLASSNNGKCHMSERSAIRTRGVLLAGPDGLRLVPLDGKKRMRGIAVVGQAADALNLLHPDGMEPWIAAARETPRKTVAGEFIVLVEGEAISLAHAEVRRVTEEELRQANRIDLDQALTTLREAGIRPAMSAEDLMKLTRGDDEDIAPAPGP